LVMVFLSVDYREKRWSKSFYLKREPLFLQDSARFVDIRVNAITSSTSDALLKHRLNGPYKSRILVVNMAALSRCEINRLCVA
jgi:hypothetical protein